MSVIGLIIVVMIVIGLGGGSAYILFLLSRPKKMTWNADVFQLSEGVKPPIKDKKGNVISEIKLNDIRPYCKDIIEKVDRGPGVVIYWLKKLKKSVDEVTSEYVDYWGPKDKKVTVLLDGETATLLKKGYNKKSGDMIFNPMPSSRINLINAQQTMRKDRQKQKKDILSAIMTAVGIGIAIVGLIAIVWVQVQGSIEISENNKATADMLSTRYIEAARIIKGLPIDSENENIKKEEPPVIHDNG